MISPLVSRRTRYYVHYESGNFAIRAGAYFSEFVKTDLILKHLYAHNLGKKCPINHALGIKLRSSRLIHLPANKIEGVRGRPRLEKENCNLGFYKTGGARAVDSSRPFSIEPIFLLHNSRDQLREGKETPGYPYGDIKSIFHPYYVFLSFRFDFKCIVAT